MYKLGNLSNWIGRDTQNSDEYIFQKIKLLNLDTKCLSYKDQGVGYALIGFCSDEGVKRNQGRVGAAEGPKVFRDCFAKMPLFDNKVNYYDAGDVVCVKGDLESAQRELAKRVVQVLSLGLKPIVIGGGHEVSWGHFLGLKEFFDKKFNTAILNFDAHFDLREPIGELATSGTPFYQMNEYLQNKDRPFNYCCVGIQKSANSRSLFEYANTHEVQYLLAEDINNNPLNLDFIKNIIKKYSYIYISICLDVFSASIAPGVSAPQALGIYPNYVIQALKLLKESGKVLSLDIAELSPLYDRNQQTAKLAACLVFEFISCGDSKYENSRTK